MSDYTTIRVDQQTYDHLRRLALMLAVRRGVKPTIAEALRQMVTITDEALKSEEATK